MQRFFFSLLLCLIVTVVMAQHEDHMPTRPEPVTSPEPAKAPVPADTPEPADTHEPAEIHGTHESMSMTHMTMSQTAPLGLLPNRVSSGTAWMPDSTPMYGLMRQEDEWHFMLHGAAHLGFDKMNGPRGDSTWTLPNWAMLMAERSVNTNDQLMLRLMVSLDPVTVGGAGYPLLFQTGETWNDEPLKDHQHPHNYISELAATYTHEFSKHRAGFIYAAAVGEPALGPPTFMHRTLALDDPMAPISHHWQDATHIAYGVVTAGYESQDWKLELSTFNGREPGENRFRIQTPTFDSLSGRISWNPSPNWALQVSHAFLESPEEIHPEEDVHRTTTSVIYNNPLGLTRNFQSAFVWGRNRFQGDNSDSYLFEAQLKQDGGWTPYLRYEHVAKSGEELVLPEGYDAHHTYALQQITLGVVRDLPFGGDFQWGIGAQGFINIVPDELEPVYGNDPGGWLVYIRVHPKRM